LRIEVAHFKKGIFISQQKYVMGLLKETGKTICRRISTPVDPNIKLGSVKEKYHEQGNISKTRGQTYLLISH